MLGYRTCGNAGHSYHNRAPAIFMTNNLSIHGLTTGFMVFYGSTVIQSNLCFDHGEALDSAIGSDIGSEQERNERSKRCGFLSPLGCLPGSSHGAVNEVHRRTMPVCTRSLRSGLCSTRQCNNLVGYSPPPKPCRHRNSISLSTTPDNAQQLMIL